MLRFQVYRDGEPPTDFDLSAVYLVGADSVPARGEFAYTDGEIRCRKRAAGPSALVVMWEVKGFGQVMLETVRLPERSNPYILNLELARSRMMRLVQKREDWGLFEVPDAHQVNEKYVEARDLLIEALENLDDPARASVLADRCLALAIPLSEHTAAVHAELLLHRRISTRSFSAGVFGCQVDLNSTDENSRRRLMSAADFAIVPTPWKVIEPTEQMVGWRAFDEWTDFLRRAKMPMSAGPLVHFSQNYIPDWLYIWEHDYETVRGLLYEHIERVVTRYAASVGLWNVISGLHVNSHFSFTFDQIMDLTRMSVNLVKKINPNAKTMIEIAQPWGEYYSKNQRSIPPMIYAEMATQSSVPFDVFGLQLSFGVPRDGCWLRDLFQISMMLDRFAPLGKPVIVTRLAVPSAASDATKNGGVWRRAWNDQLQAKWLEAVTNIILSKPFVEAICWNQLLDGESGPIPAAGLFAADFAAKPAFQVWSGMRRAVINVRMGTTKQSEGSRVAGQAPATAAAPVAPASNPGTKPV